MIIFRFCELGGIEGLMMCIYVIESMEITNKSKTPEKKKKSRIKC